jgi:hypothetical protein
MSSNPGDATARPAASAAAFPVSVLPASPASAIPVRKTWPSSTPVARLSRFAIRHATRSLSLTWRATCAHEMLDPETPFSPQRVANVCPKSCRRDLLDCCQGDALAMVGSVETLEGLARVAP